MVIEKYEFFRISKMSKIRHLSGDNGNTSLPLSTQSFLPRNSDTEKMEQQERFIV